GMNSGVITGRVLEIGDRRYTSRFGVDVTQSDVLSAEADDATTYVGDLSSCPQIPADAYDCFILTQTLHYLYDMEAGVREIHRILKPGGTVLCTVPGISQISRFDMDRWGDRWRLTSLSAAELFGTTFSSDAVRVATFGNAHSAACFLQGIPAERVNKTKLERNEPDYQLIVAVRATKHADG
ncbi:MAG: class I SAM-dependent methyltransferase, partial [Actinobacteria bacterium]|nr:class I SAM-dependent methyltransferase [Actinomycetota bacterium]MCG2806944.1 class I SAM-dependent methyltransferase [Coriobacteriia bacterium]